VPAQKDAILGRGLGRAEGPTPPSKRVGVLAFDLLVKYVRSVLVAEGGGRMPRGKVAEIIGQLAPDLESNAVAGDLVRQVESKLRFEMSGGRGAQTVASVKKSEKSLS